MVTEEVWRKPGSGRVAHPGTGDEDEAELADLDLVAVGGRWW
jgi:hypothetical protein